jgi:hypothetical protein
VIWFTLWMRLRALVAEQGSMEQHVSGEAAPTTGTYELRNIFGAIIGIRVNLARGQKWTRADEEAAEW